MRKKPLSLEDIKILIDEELYGDYSGLDKAAKAIYDALPSKDEGIRSMEEFQRKYFPNLVGKECPYCGTPSKGIPVEHREDCPPNIMYLVNKDYMKNESKGMVEKDLSIHGVSITKDGERVDPKDFYIAPKEGSSFWKDTPDTSNSMIAQDLIKKKELYEAIEGSSAIEIVNDIRGIKTWSSEEDNWSAFQEGRMSKRALLGSIADHLIKLGYAKLSAKPELVELNKEAVIEIADDILRGNFPLAEAIGIAICKKFGTKPNLPTVEEN